jgi:predicted ATPase/DNA-binding SARP family transcriptional activator
MSIELRILGALEVVAEGRPLALGGRKQRALLALLALHANELVSSDRLLEEVWPDSEPGAAAPSLHVYVSQLRKALGGSAAALETRPGGYALALAPDQLDAVRFERLLREGRQALAAGEPEHARAMLTEALSLWRGPALADLAYQSFAERESARLQELRLEALEGRLEAELQLGRHAELVSELEGLVQAEPLRERMRGQLMLALYRSGRQADALESYREGRQALVSELGLEPGPELRELEAAILRQDSSLAVEPPELRARRHLPAPATPLVGRRRETDDVVSLLGDGTRLVTLSGAGGVGKTRLALQAAHELAECFPDGVYFVGLAPVRDPELVPAAIGGALGVREAAPRPFVDSLKEHLRSRRLLLVLDNFEHVDEAAPLVGELLAEASGLKALITSRAGLHLYGEHEYQVPPLTEEEAVELFAARAQAARPGFALDGARTHVAELVRRLDGLPLAIELAAARSSELSPGQMLGFLTNRLELVTAGPRDVAARQQTLRATIEWSYDLLDEAERALFARLGVFAAGCTLAAAEGVCAADLETLASLVDKSLVREQEGPDGDPRFEMLETIREYALERLDESGEAEAVRRKHAEHFLALIKEAEGHVFAADQSSWLERLEVDHANLNAARLFLTRSGSRELALELVAAIWRFLYVGGRLTEGRTWLEEALAETHEPTIPRVRALQGAGMLATSQNANEHGRKRIEEALALARQLGDTWGIAASQNLLGTHSLLGGDEERAVALHDESVVLFREVGDQRMLSAATANLGVSAFSRGDYDRAVDLLEESLTIARSLQSTKDVAMMLNTLGLATLCQSHVDEGEALLRESLALAEQGEFKVVVLWGLEGLAAVAAARGEAERAARLLGASDGLAEALAVPLIEIPYVRPIRERSVAAARGELQEPAFAAALAEGRSMTLEDAIAYALAGNAPGVCDF